MLPHTYDARTRSFSLTSTMSLDSLPDDLLILVVTRLVKTSTIVTKHSETKDDIPRSAIQIITPNQLHLGYLALANKHLLYICQPIIHNEIELRPKAVSDSAVSTCQLFLDLLVERPHLTSYIR